MNLGSVWNQVVLVRPSDPKGIGILLGGTGNVDRGSRHDLRRAPGPLATAGGHPALLGTCWVPLGSLRTVLRGSLIMRVQEQVKLWADHSQCLRAGRCGAAVSPGRPLDRNWGLHVPFSSPLPGVWWLVAGPVGAVARQDIWDLGCLGHEAPWQQSSFVIWWGQDKY